MTERERKQFYARLIIVILSIIVLIGLIYHTAVLNQPTHYPSEREKVTVTNHIQQKPNG